MLYAKRQGDFRPYHRVVYERFWKRELDIENPRSDFSRWWGEEGN